MIFSHKRLIFKYPRRESNPHARRHTILSRARLPIPPLGLAGCKCKRKTDFCKGAESPTWPWQKQKSALYHVLYKFFGYG